MDASIQKAREKGYVETIMGRRRYLPDIHSHNGNVRGMAERNAINSPIQGSAADIIKIAMNNIHRELKKRQLRSKMILQVHDELVFDVYKPEADEIRQLVIYEMENALKLDVPLIVEAGIGDNWLEAH
jgi:DNA polymerase-1